MDADGHEPARQVTSDAAVEALVRTVRRQTIALWSLVVVLALAHGAPWVSYFWYSSRTPEPETSSSFKREAVPLEAEEPFDNDFHARPVEDQIKRATVIFLTRLEKVGEKHREVVSEVIKQKPGIRLYYNVGDEYERFSHLATPSCEGCEGQGQVVFMLGNPASMVYSVSYEGDRVRGMGDMPIRELRRLAGESLGAQ